MSTLPCFENDVNPDKEIPVDWPTWDRFTNRPHATPLTDFLTALGYRVPTITAEDHASNWGFRIYAVMVVLEGNEVAGTAANDTYQRFKSGFNGDRL